MKPTLVYFSYNDHSDNDITFLKYLPKEFNVIWYYMYESLKQMRLTKEEIIEYAKSNSIELHLIDPKLRYSDPRNFFFYKRVVKEINKKSPDIFFTCRRDYYMSFAIQLFLKCKHFVLGVHDANSHTESKTLRNRLWHYSINRMIKIADHYVTYSKGQHDILLKQRGLESKIVGMASKYHGPSKLTASPIRQGLKLLFFGRIDKYKGLDLLIQEIENLNIQGKTNISLTIAGKGEYWDECAKGIKTPELYNLNVRFIENCEIPDLMSSHHFLVLPYRDATQSGPLVAAVAYQLPIIAPNFGCFSDTYSSDSAILYEEGGLRQAIEKASILSQEDYNEMKEVCKSVREKNSEEPVSEKYIDYFKSILS